MRKKKYDRPGRPSISQTEGLYILINELDEVFESYQAAAKRIGGRRSGVYACLKGTGGRRTHMGFHFKFVKNK